MTAVNRETMSSPQLICAIYPCDPLDPRRVDDVFSGEWQVARDLGFETAFVDVDALDRDPERSAKGVPVQREWSPAIYRGWMLSARNYARLCGALVKRKVQLINTATEYAHAHHLPESFAAIAEYSPKTVWTDDGASFDPARVTTLLEPFGRSPIIVKDYVKSQKHYWKEACFVPDASDHQAVERVVRRFIELQDTSFVGGLVFREFVKLEPIGTHPKSGLPLTLEYRLFFLNGRLLTASEYWDECAYPSVTLPHDLFAKIASGVRSRFFTMDVARTMDGAWIVMELGDGQVAGLPGKLPPRTFYEALRARAAELAIPSRRRLFVVDDVFDVKDRGVILVPGLNEREIDRVRIGDSIEIRAPDRPAVETTIRGIDSFSPNPKRIFPILIGASKADAPPGAEVWTRPPVDN